HDYEHADVEQQYLPDELVERRYYEPTDEGWEARIKARMDELLARRQRGQRKRG
ncbi:MAG: replication-associated recombination protein A, partial [Chloroflexota bacterium]